MSQRQFLEVLFELVAETIHISNEAFKLGRVALPQAQYLPESGAQAVYLHHTAQINRNSNCPIFVILVSSGLLGS